MPRNTHRPPFQQPEFDELRELTLLSVWFRLLTIGAAVLVGSLIAIGISDSAIPTALPLAVVSAIVTPFAWRKLWETDRQMASAAVAD